MFQTQTVLKAVVLCVLDTQTVFKAAVVCVSDTQTVFKAAVQTRDGSRFSNIRLVDLIIEYRLGCVF